MATYKYKFMSEPDDDLKCLICLEIAEEPWQHGKCGRLFCKMCLDKNGKDKPCPNCREKRPNYFLDGKSQLHTKQKLHFSRMDAFKVKREGGKRNVQALAVKCGNVDRKCEWVGTVGTLEEHVATCKFTLLPCPKQCKDNKNKVKHFMRKDIDKHLKKDCPNRIYNCVYCGEKGTYAVITQIHDNTCKKKIIPCRNVKVGCHSIMQRQVLGKHINTECKYAVIPCKYKRFGCDTDLKRKNMVAHELDDQHHLHMALDTVVELENTVAALQERTTNLSAVVIPQETLKNGESMKFKLTEYQKKKANSEIANSPSYYIYPNGYHMAIRVDVNGYSEGKGTHVSVGALILKGNYDAELKWPLIGKITFTLLNQLKDDNHHFLSIYLTAAHNTQVGKAWGLDVFIPHSNLGRDPVKNVQVPQG